jgi:2-keto-4-pentenoate hydratase/2-oxohepta-3-ene-1,7-dioic acid hydratase in catechol pathway
MSCIWGYNTINRVPILFYKPVTSLIGPSSNIIIPNVACPVDRHIPDYEVELAVVIGKPAKNVSEEDALDFVLGYTGSNDVTKSTVIQHLTWY